MDQLFQNLQKLSVGRLIALAGTLAGTIAFMMWVVTKVSAPSMELLYADLTPSDSGQIISKLDGMGIPYDIKGDGTQLYVPVENVARIRLAMAEAGLPGGANMGYEIFDKNDSIGTNSFVQNINHLRALEGELSRTISSIGQVHSARVHLVLPRRELFSRTVQSPSGSVVLRLRGNMGLSNTQIQSIQHLVAAAVPGLSPDNVAIIDGNGNLLARGEKDGASGASSRADEQRVEYETRLAKSIESLLEKSVGFGRVRAEVSVQLDPEHYRENSESFNPEGQVARSTKATSEETTKNNKDAQVITAENNVTGEAGQAPGDGTAESKKRMDEVTNYEISKTTRQLVHEPGGVKRLSVAVLVDGTYTKTEEGGQNYAPRDATQMDLLNKLVKSAVGYNEDRGDIIEVVNMQFAKEDAPVETPAEEGILGLKRHEVMRLAETGAVFLLGLLFLFMVVRPVFKRLTTPLEPVTGAGVPALDGATPTTPQALTAENVSSEPGQPQPANLTPTNLEKMIDIQKIEGQVRASSVKQVGEVIDKHPEEAVAIIRSWLMKE